MNPTFSLITPTKNRNETLERAFLSLRKQEFPDWEWIIIDDGSDFFYASTLERLDIRIKSFRNPGPFGKGDARNMGLKKATGNWIGFLDDDDELLPDCLSTLNSVIQSNKGAKALYRGELIIRTKLNVYSPARSAIHSQDDWIHYLFHIANIFPWVGPASSLKQLKFSKDPVFQDAQFFLTAALDLPIVRIHKTLGIYNLHDVSLTGQASKTKNPDDLLHDELTALENLFELKHPKIKAYKKAGIYKLARAIRYIHHATAIQSYPLSKAWKNALSESKSFITISKLIKASYLRLESNIPRLLAIRQLVFSRKLNRSS